jgi:hypothetical protein
MSAANIEDPVGPRLSDPLCHVGMHIVVAPLAFDKNRSGSVS